MRGKGVQIAPAQPTSADTALTEILAAELRVPLLEARQALSIAHHENNLELVSSATASLTQGLQLLEHYMASGHLLRSDEQLAYKTVTIGALLEEVAHKAYPLARMHEVKLELDYRHIKRPVLVDAEKIGLLLENLVMAFLRLPSKRVLLGAHVTRNGMRTGVFSDQLDSGLLMRQVQRLGSIARQPGKHAASGTAHLLIADWIGQKAELPIGAGKHSEMNGLAITVPWSMQLSLI